ncbi:hypothetical protein MAMP_00494 [Methylophaga aminisulfidivorans MP]|uniref:Uncharacterized protein n=1 Tax=Methylophaga aminisulfidivorans MP TaxID=1026882 RepID=F5SYB4_9GAMM|nr:hypothetical protein [Methylophaga aminisulfidivorans]EGL54160.1 hypothetical protein MAMP_00494 [Methylophaga aminisulfidivorans MP]
MSIRSGSLKTGRHYNADSRESMREMLESTLFINDNAEVTLFHD